MTLAANYISALRRIPVPSLPNRMADVDELKNILTLLDQAIDAGGTGGGTSIALDITSPPYNADKTGANDCSAALTAAFNDGHRRIWFPEGVYKFSSIVLVPVGTVLLGAGHTRTKIVAEGDQWINGQFTIGGDGKPNVSRIWVSGFHIHMAKGGLYMAGHELRLSELRFSGGTAGYWCIQLWASNESAIWNCSGGYGIDPNDALVANGIRWYADDTDNPVNYGDGLIMECAFKGTADNWIGLALEHQGNHATRGVVNNITVVRCQFQAPGSGSDPLANPYDSGSVRVKNGSIGVRLEAVARCTFIGVDVEASFYGFYCKGRSTGLGGRAVKRNTFITCQGFNTRYGFYAEVPDDGSVGQNHFVGCQEVQPLLPVVFSNGDPNNTYLGRASAHDWWLPNALWFARPGNGVPKVALRCSDGEHLYIVHDYQEPSRDGSLLYPYDAAPKYKTPRKALAIDVASSPNAARLYRPQGFVAANSLSGTTDDNSAPGAPQKDSRIIIGNGQGFVVDGQPVNPLHRVEIADPLYITEWSSPLVALYGGDAPGIIANARYETVIGTTARWRGPGAYQKVRIAGSSSFEWRPMFDVPGWRLCQMGRSGASYTVDRDWFGKLLEHTAAATITIPADLIHADEQTAAPGQTAGREFLLKCGLNTVTLQAGTGVTFYVAGSTSPVSSWSTTGTSQFVLVIYQRTGSGTARVDVVPLGGAAGSGITVNHVSTNVGNGGSLDASNASVRASGSTLFLDSLLLRNSTPTNPVTVSLVEAAATVGRTWSGRVADDQTGAVTIQAPGGGLINGRSSISIEPAGGRFEIECTSATPGATRFQAWGDIKLPDITGNVTWELFDKGERRITAANAIVTVPTSFKGDGAVFCTAPAATLRINDSTDIALTAGDYCSFRGTGTVTYAYRSDPTLS